MQPLQFQALMFSFKGLSRPLRLRDIKLPSTHPVCTGRVVEVPWEPEVRKIRTVPEPLPEGASTSPLPKLHPAMGRDNQQRSCCESTYNAVLHWGWSTLEALCRWDCGKTRNLRVSGTPPNSDLLDEALTLFGDAQKPGIRKSRLVLLGSLIVQEHVAQLELGQYRLEDLIYKMRIRCPVIL